jgi:hypothetical protein
MRGEYKNPLQPAVKLTSEGLPCPKIGTARGLSRLTCAFNPAWETGAEEKISALIIKRDRPTLRITQRNSKSFTVKSFKEPKLLKSVQNLVNVKAHPNSGLWLKINWIQCGLGRICSASPSPPTYVGKPEIFFQPCGAIKGVTADSSLNKMDDLLDLNRL